MANSNSKPKASFPVATAKQAPKKENVFSTPQKVCSGGKAKRMACGGKASKRGC